MTRFLLMPFKPTVLMLVALWTVFFAILEFAGMIGALIAVVPVSWFFKYCFVLLDAAIAGDEEPPVLDIDMVNVLSEQRPLAALAIIGAGLVVVRLAARIAGEPGLIAAAAVLLTGLPASIAVLALTSHPLKAASPTALFKFIRELGRPYAGLAIATSVLGAGLYALVRRPAPVALIAILGELGFLLLFALIGGTVHQNRYRLGITTRTLAERRAERERAEHAAARKRMLDHSFNQLRLGRAAESWAPIERWIAAYACGDRLHAEFAALLDSTLTWEPPVVGDRLASEYLSRLLALKENGRALEVLERRLSSNPRFRPGEPQETRRLRELAALAGKRGLCRELEG